MTDQEYKYIEGVPSVGEFATEKRGGYAPAQVDAALKEFRDFSTDTANKYNQVLKNFSDLAVEKASVDRRVTELEQAAAGAIDAKAVEVQIADLKKSHAAELESEREALAAEREQLQAAFADAVKAEAAKLAPSADAEKSKVADIVEAITDEATVFVKKSIDRVVALEEEARTEAEATKQAARNEAHRLVSEAQAEADRLLAGAREEATSIVVSAREEANRALDARNKAVTETKEIWERLNMFATAQSQQAQTQVSGLATSDLYELEAPLAADSAPTVEGSEERTV